jgi:ubiquinone/menaquinone biosynthesis C-methylase UbiE
MKKTQRIFWNEHYRQHSNAWRKINYFEENFNKKSVLELGCGNGKSIAGIIEKNPLRLVAIDFSEIAVDLAKKRFGEKIKVICADCLDLPFEKEEFDYIIANHIIGAMIQKDREKCVSEIFRVLKKRGRIIFSDFSIGDLREKGTLIELNTYQKRNGIIQHFFTEKEVKNLFSKFLETKIKTVSNYLTLNKKRVLRSEIFANIIK